MDKKIFGVYLAKDGVPNNEAYARLDLPASPWVLWDAMDKVRLLDGEILYLEIDEYYRFDALAPHLAGLDIGLNELNDLAERLAKLDEVQGIAYRGLLEMAVQEKVESNGGIITIQELRDLAVSAKTDCYHVVEAADDAQLGRFYAENDFVPELDGISDEVFEMLDFAGIGRMMRHSENGVFVGNLYVLQDGELTTAPPCAKDLPEKPGYLFRLTLGLHPDIGDERTVTLDLPAAEAELLDAQAQLGTLNWENTVVLNYDGILPNAAFFADLPSELETFNEFAKAYLSAILDLKGRDIVSFAIGRHNNNQLVFETFDLAIQKYPDAHPLFHSDRGFQYTSKQFKDMLEKQGMRQSMSRVGRCIDNGPMEGFWGILKCEMYYLNHFETYEELVDAVGQFIHYYNYQRRQHRLNCLAPMDYRSLLEVA